MRRLSTILAAILLVSPVLAQDWDIRTDDAWCDRDSGQRYCEVRETTIAALPRALSVIPGMNGGVRVEGWDRGDVRIEAKVSVWERGRASARDIADRVEIFADGSEIRTDGPEGKNAGWSVSFRIRVPRDSDLALETHNGGISIDGVRGEIRFEALNGGVKLTRLAGDVRGQTMNGGLSVRLDGYEWEGVGLDVRTTNGGVKLAIPDGYNAELTTGTVNGSMRTDIPLRVRGDLSKRIRTTLGNGGAPVSVVTTNGGVKLTR